MNMPYTTAAEVSSHDVSMPSTRRGAMSGATDETTLDMDGVDVQPEGRRQHDRRERPHDVWPRHPTDLTHYGLGSASSDESSRWLPSEFQSSAPIHFLRITPSRPITNVSGTPVVR